MNNKKLLNEFIKFKKSYNYSSPVLTESNGELFANGELIKSDKTEEPSESNTYIDVGFKNKGQSKLLSNLFHYEFKFRGKTLSSIESFFQGIKFKDKKTQNLVFKYSGINALNIKYASDYDWTLTQCIYWQGKKINRHSSEYETLVDELYICATSNPLYKGALLNVKNKIILHSIGNEDDNKTVFTRYEFEKELNCLKDFLLLKENKQK